MCFGRGSGDEDRGGMAVNFYHDGSARKYLANGHASIIDLQDGLIIFSNASSNSSGAGAAMTANERLRIDSDGNLKMPAGAFDLRVGDNTNSNAGTQTISVGSISSGSSGGIGIFANPTNGNSFVQFGDGTAAADQYRGYMNYQHASDKLIFGAGGANRLTITSTGNLEQVSTGGGISYFTGSSEYIYGSAYSSPNQGGNEANVQIHSYKTRAQFSINAYMNNSGGPFAQFVSSRSGTVGVLGTKCLSGDQLGEHRYFGDNGTNGGTLAHGASISAKANGSISDGDTCIEGQLNFSTGNTAGGSVQTKLRIEGGGKVKYGLHDSSMPHAIQARGFVLYPNNGSNNKTTIRVSGLVSGCFIFQMGYYNSGGQGEGGFACAVSGYMTTTNQYLITNLHGPYAHANSSISSINKQNSYFEFTITNSHASYTGGGTIGIIGDQEMNITVTYHS